MSVRVMNYVWQQSQQKGSALLLLLAIADAADDDGCNAWPAVSTLAKKIRMSDRTVQNLVAELVASGELRVDLGGGKHGTHRYTVVLPEAFDTARRPGRPRKAAEKGVQTLHPEKSAGVQSATDGGAGSAGGVQSATDGGETATAPNPSLTRPVNPSEDPSGDEYIPRAPRREIRPVPKPGEVERADRELRPTWRALVRVAGEAPAPGTEEERWVKAHEAIVGACERAGLTDELAQAHEIHVRSLRYAQSLTVRLTVPGLAANWAALAHDPPPRPGDAPARASPGDAEALIAAQPPKTRRLYAAGQRFIERGEHGQDAVFRAFLAPGGGDQQGAERRADGAVVREVRHLPGGDVRGGGKPRDG